MFYEAIQKTAWLHLLLCVFFYITSYIFTSFFFFLNLCSDIFVVLIKESHKRSHKHILSSKVFRIWLVWILHVLHCLLNSGIFLSLRGLRYLGAWMEEFVDDFSWVSLKTCNFSLISLATVTHFLLSQNATCAVFPNWRVLRNYQWYIPFFLLLIFFFLIFILWDTCLVHWKYSGWDFFFQLCLF